MRNKKLIVYDGTNIKEIHDQKHRMLAKRTIEQKFETMLAFQKLMKTLRKHRKKEADNARIN